MIMQSTKPSNSDFWRPFKHVVDPTRVRIVADKNAAITPLDPSPNSRELGFQGPCRRNARAIQLRNEYAIVIWRIQKDQI